MGDVLPKLWSLTGSWLLQYFPARFSGEITHSIVFVLTFIVIQQILSLPTSIYHTFVLEEKFGFNKQTPKLFVMDMLKSQMLAFILAPPILAGFLKIVQKTGNGFFYYLWMFGAGLQVFMITIYPITILPLFNKLSPLQPGDLKTGVEGLAERLKFPLHEPTLLMAAREVLTATRISLVCHGRSTLSFTTPLLKRARHKKLWLFLHMNWVTGVLDIPLDYLASHRPISSTFLPSSPSSSTTSPSTNPSDSITSSQSSLGSSSSRMLLRQWTQLSSF